jgi:hypothetical protein
MQVHPPRHAHPPSHWHSHTISRALFLHFSLPHPPSPTPFHPDAMMQLLVDTYGAGVDRGLTSPAPTAAPTPPPTPYPSVPPTPPTKAPTAAPTKVPVVWSAPTGYPTDTTVAKENDGTHGKNSAGTSALDGSDALGNDGATALLTVLWPMYVLAAVLAICAYYKCHKSWFRYRQRLVDKTKGARSGFDTTIFNSRDYSHAGGKSGGKATGGMNGAKQKGKKRGKGGAKATSAGVKVESTPRRKERRVRNGAQQGARRKERRVRNGAQQEARGTPMVLSGGAAAGIGTGAGYIIGTAPPERRGRGGVQHSAPSDAATVDHRGRKLARKQHRPRSRAASSNGVRAVAGGVRTGAGSGGIGQSVDAEATFMSSSFSKVELGALRAVGHIDRANSQMLPHLSSPISIVSSVVSPQGQGLFHARDPVPMVDGPAHALYCDGVTSRSAVKVGPNSARDPSGVVAAAAGVPMGFSELTARLGMVGLRGDDQSRPQPQPRRSR